MLYISTSLRYRNISYTQYAFRIASVILIYLKSCFNLLELYKNELFFLLCLCLFYLFVVFSVVTHLFTTIKFIRISRLRIAEIYELLKLKPQA